MFLGPYQRQWQNGSSRQIANEAERTRSQGAYIFANGQNAGYYCRLFSDEEIPVSGGFESSRFFLSFKAHENCNEPVGLFMSRFVGKMTESLPCYLEY